MRAIGVVKILSLMLLGMPAAADEDSLEKEFERRFRPFFQQHCVSCHGDHSQKGNLRLDTLKLELNVIEIREKWTHILERLRSGEMPPKDQPRPHPEDAQAILDWMSLRLKDAESAARGTEGRVVLRRLNRDEYQRTLCDLLGIQIEIREQLPEDGSAGGFDNVAAAQHLSSFLLEKYLDVADMALNAAIANRERPPPVSSKRYSLKEGHPIRGGSHEDVYRFLNDGTVVCFCSSDWHNVSISPFYPSDAGHYRFRISASSVQDDDRPVTFRVTVTGTRLTGKSGLIGYFDAPAHQPTVIEFDRFMDPRTTISLLPYGLAGANTVKQVGGERWEGPGLAIQFVEIEGPLNETWPPPSHRRLFGDLPRKAVEKGNNRVEVVSDQTRVDAERILSSFIRKAFRRKVEADDVAPFLKILEQKLSDGYTFERAIRASLKGVLISPSFLFLDERPGQLDDFALASRLSYFLWSTMPDETLLTLAEQERLHHPVVLREQVERLLNDPKAAVFTERFVGQWLGLREIDATEPSHLLYPEFDHLLKVSMIREAELFFEEILKHNLSVTNFTASNFTMLNGRLAKHYGIPGVDGWQFQRVALPAESHRGGVMTMAGVLKVTANGTTTSPVLRGAWVLDRLLGTPPAPPPDDISAIDPDIRGATTIREQLTKHRTDEACAVCHRHIDPPGFALESFDCIGGFRDRYRVTGNGDSVVIDGRRMPYHRGMKVDPADVAADGTPFANIDEFKEILLRDKPRLARAIAQKLVIYATGRAPLSGDRAAVDAIVADSAEQGYGLRTMIHSLVQSDLFRNK